MQNTTAYINAFLLFFASSVGMMLCNKLAVTAIPLPCFLVLLQTVVTLVLLLAFRSELDALTQQKMRKWTPIAFLFAVMLFTSMKSFLYLNVATIVIIRNLGSIISTVVEYYLLGENVNTEIVLSQLAILFGAILYGENNASLSGIAMFWMLSNIVAQVAYGILVRHVTSNVSEFSSASKYTLALYNNLIATPMLLIIFFAQEYWKVYESLPRVTIIGWSWIALTCLFGFMISTSGFGLQKLVSATTFVVINNLTKFANILIGVMLMGDPIGLVDGVGCAVALGAGAWYSLALYQFKSRALLKEDKKEGMTAGKSPGEIP